MVSLAAAPLTSATASQASVSIRLPPAAAGCATTMACRVSPDEEAQESRKRPTKHLQIIAGCLLVCLVFAVSIPIYYNMEMEPPPDNGLCDIDSSVRLNRYTTYQNGSISDNGVVYPAGYHFRSGDGATMGCVCAFRPCVRKCCDKGEYLFATDGPSGKAHCTKHTGPNSFENFSYPVYDSKNTTEMLNVPRNHFKILYGDVCKNGKYILMPWEFEQDKSYLLDDGRILLDDSFFHSTQYCLEAVNGLEGLQTLVCFPPDEDAETKAIFTFYPIGMILSSPFLFVTFLVYAVIPDLRNLHGKSLMCHVASLLAAYLTLSTVQIGGDWISASWCFSLAFVVQFSFLATFFWLNVMCFDIWWVFSGLRPMQGSKKEREHKKFILYSLYAWGGPLIIFIITLCVELIPSIPDTFIKPNFGFNKCWFKDSKGTVLYFYLPIGVLVLLNIVMFITTAFRLQVHTRETKSVLKGKDSGKSDEADRQRFNLYLKLFIVMGINWVMELVSFVVGGPKSLWYVSDISNTLQGLLIFLIFVWKRRILRLLNQKICPNWNLVSATSTSKGSKVSSSRTSSSNLSKTVNSNPESVAMQPIARKISTSDDSDANN